MRNCSITSQWGHFGHCRWLELPKSSHFERIWRSKQVGWRIVQPQKQAGIWCSARGSQPRGEEPGKPRSVPVSALWLWQLITARLAYKISKWEQNVWIEGRARRVRIRHFTRSCQAEVQLNKCKVKVTLPQTQPSVKLTAHVLWKSWMSNVSIVFNPRHVSLPLGRDWLRSVITDLVRYDDTRNINALQGAIQEHLHQNMCFLSKI